MITGNRWRAFLERMTTETGDPDPRWLYLTRKVCDTCAIFVALRYVLTLPPVLAALLAVALYVGAGLVVWYAAHPVTFGGVLVDLVYHAAVSAIVLALVFVWATSAVWWAAFAVLAGWLVLFVALELAGFGRVRAP